MIELTSAMAILAVTLASAIICHMMAKKRGRKPVFWGVMGALFGPIAIPFIFLSRKMADKD